MASAVFVLALVAFAVCSVFGAPSRIVGGALTTIERYPSIVAVENRNTGGTWFQNCAASIVNERNVVSAAHCFIGRNYRPQDRRIRAGSSFRSSGGVVINVVREFNHPTYGSNGEDGDITVVRLSSSIVYTPIIQRVPIVAAGFEVPDNSPVVHAGWGAIFSNGPSSNQLRDVTINTINRQVCFDAYSITVIPMPVTENMICAGVPNGGMDSCQGDSGGPMYFGDILVGIVSWGIGCGNPRFPGVSTRVASYTNWIVATAL